MEYSQETVAATLQKLSTSAQDGLSHEQAAQRLLKYGPNELAAAKGVNPFSLFIGQFRNFIIYILLFAVAISLLAHEYVDAIVILIILFFNAIFGFIQEYRAEKSIEALKNLAGFKTKVTRDGITMLVDAKDLCPGDIMHLEAGSKVCADARIISASVLEIEESSLTGESSSVGKHANALTHKLPINDQRNMVFSGTSVVSGRGLAVVTGTGMHTQLGKIAHLINEVEDEMTPLQKKLNVLGTWIGSATIVVCIFIFFTGVIRDGLLSLLFAGEYLAFILASKTWFLTAVSLAVAAVPEGLPAIVTISLAIGVNKMLKRKALIRKLPSVETLGETTVICSDKTGTLTKNQMTVEVAYVNGKEFHVSGSGYALSGDVLHDGTAPSKEELLLFHIGALCNDASLNAGGMIGDPTEGALLVSAHKAGLIAQIEANAHKRIHEFPFDSGRKLMTTIHNDPATKQKMAYMKGAPERVLAVCDRVLLNGKEVKLTAQLRKKILAQNDGYAKNALRVLGFAYKPLVKGVDVSAQQHIEQQLIFVGLQGMMDPPHDEVKDAIAKCHRAGIHTIMITGDNQLTAKGIAQKIGLHGDAMDGLAFAALSTPAQFKALKHVAIFSRVEPQHKILIVSLLQQQGEIVTMTGDGINDAPAVKKADLGVAMGISGTDVTKEASKMIVLDDNFTSIVNAIEEGRWIYANIKKFVNYLLSCNVGEVLIIFFAILFDWHLPMTAIMLLWLNLVTDGLPALALSVDPNKDDMMNKPPQKANEGIMNTSMFIHIFFVASLITIGTLSLFYWAMGYYAGTETFIAKTQTIAFTAIIVMEIVRLQAIRAEYNLGMFSNPWLTCAVLVSIGLQLLVVYTPLQQYFGTVALSLLDWAMILGVSALLFVANVLGGKVINHYLEKAEARR